MGTVDESKVTFWAFFFFLFIWIACDEVTDLIRFCVLANLGAFFKPTGGVGSFWGSFA